MDERFVPIGPRQDFMQVLRRLVRDAAQAYQADAPSRDGAAVSVDR
jgi:hypothetical protein